MTPRFSAEAPPFPVRGPADGLCLDFANTRYWRGTERPTETLAAPADLLGWLGSVGVAQPALQAAADWAADPAMAAAALAASLAIREAIYRSFAAIARDAGPPPADLAALNAALAAAPGRSRLLAGPDGCGWAVPGAGADVAALLAPVLWSAGDLLAGPRRARVRRCANDRCLWLFVDASKSGSRRWCDMAACGNRAKAHRHYTKLKQAKEG